jgi:hypothetical protein
MHEDRLGLVVGVVPDGDGCGAHPARHLSQEGISHPPSGLFHSDTFLSRERRDVGPIDGAIQPPGGSGGLDEGGIRCSILTTQAVMQVGDVQVKLEGCPQVQEKVQQAEGIGAAGHADHDLVSGCQQFVALDVPPHLFLQNWS